MGNLSSTDAICADEFYPGFDNEGKSACMGERWIVLNKDPSTTEKFTPEMLENLSKTRSIIKKAKYPENQVWWFFRWIYFDRHGSSKDIAARIKFLHKFLSSTKFHGFLSHDEATELAKANRNKYVLSLEETIPGNINFTMVTSDDEFHTSMKTIDTNTIKKIKSLEQITKEQCETKVCKLLKR